MEKESKLSGETLKGWTVDGVIHHLPSTRPTFQSYISLISKAKD